MVSKAAAACKHKVQSSGERLQPRRKPWEADDKRASPVRAKDACDAGQLDSKSLALHILSRLLQILRPTQIAPIIFVRTKAENLFSLSSEPKIRSDNREGAVFG